VKLDRVDGKAARDGRLQIPDAHEAGASLTMAIAIGSHPARQTDLVADLVRSHDPGAADVVVTASQATINLGERLPPPIESAECLFHVFNRPRV
jgi:hypothetical protein